MKLIKVYVSDDFKSEIDDAARKQGINTSKFAGSLMKSGMMLRRTKKPDVSTKLAKDSLIGVNSEDAERIENQCKALGISSEEYISSLLNKDTDISVNIEFLEDFRNDYREIKDDIRNISYLISHDDEQQISEAMVSKLNESIQSLSKIFADIQHECIKMRISIDQKIRKKTR